MSGPVTGGSRTGMPYNASLFDLSQNGYVEEEFFISGTATNPLNPAQPAAPFTTRMVVRSPIDPARFNGTVYIEWLNVTSGLEIEAQYAYVIPEILREGSVAVILGAQAAGVSSTRSWDLARYASMTHPGDDYSFDIASQAAQALRNPDPGGIDPLDGLSVERVLLGGESQSASRVASYVNGIYPLVEAVFDGFLIEVGGGNNFRADLDVPVIQVQSERESGGGPPDSAFYRRWEIAGGSHQDRYSLTYAGLTGDRDHSLPPGSFPLNPPDTPNCTLNRSTKFLVLRSALHSLDRWVRDGTPPATAPRLEMDGAGIVRDAFGNALGGLRLPFIDVPVARYRGDNQECAPLAGETEFFDTATLASLYANQADYEAQLAAASDAAVAAGYLLPADRHTWYCGDYVLGDEQIFLPTRDCDGDGAAYSVDTCPALSNADQADTGGLDSPVPDGIGNACQCGDVTGNGIVNGQDGGVIARHSFGIEPNPLFLEPGNCDVTGNTACNGQDRNAIRRAALGVPSPLFGQNCPNAKGAL